MEELRMKATAAVPQRLPNSNLSSSGNTLINIQIKAAQLNRIKSMFPFFPFSSRALRSHVQEWNQDQEKQCGLVQTAMITLIQFKMLKGK